VWQLALKYLSWYRAFRSFSVSRAWWTPILYEIVDSRASSSDTLSEWAVIHLTVNWKVVFLLFVHLFENHTFSHCARSKLHTTLGDSLWVLWSITSCFCSSDVSSTSGRANNRLSRSDSPSRRNAYWQMLFRKMRP
jgi:hypothetical protein